MEIWMVFSLHDYSHWYIIWVRWLQGIFFLYWEDKTLKTNFLIIRMDSGLFLWSCQLHSFEFQYVLMSDEKKDGITSWPGKLDVLWEGQNWSGIVASVLERNRISRISLYRYRFRYIYIYIYWSIYLHRHLDKWRIHRQVDR